MPRPIRQQVLGPAHPETADSRQHYARLLRKLGRETEAARLQGRPL